MNVNTRNGRKHHMNGGTQSVNKLLLGWMNNPTILCNI